MSVVKISEKRIFPSSSHPSQTWALSMNDLIMPAVNISWVAFFENDGSKDFMSPGILEPALSKALDLYPLLAGRLVSLPLGHFQLEYNQESLQGCTFSQAKADFTLASLRDSKFVLRAIPKEILPCSPYPGPDVPIFAVQHTKLACGSVAMSYSMHHKVGDGFSIQTFIEKWSRVCRGLEIEKPLLDRSALGTNADPVAEHPEYKIADVPFTMPAVIPPMKRAIFTFTPEKIAQLKQAANSSLEKGRWVSTNDCVVTLVWRAITRARGLTSGDATACGIAADGRKKWSTPLGDMSQYFGNFITFPTATTDVGTLLGSSLGGAALILREQVEKMDHARIQSMLNWISRVHDKSKIHYSFKMFLGQDIFISSWLTFPMYDSDFGWGKPAKAVLQAPGSDGISLILPRGPTSELDKYGMEVVLGAIDAHMETLINDPELTQFSTGIIDS